MTDSMINHAPTLNGLILAGGQSLRMGSAKAHLNYGKGPQWQVCEELLQPFCQNVYFSVSPHLDQPLPVGEERLVRDIFVKPIGPLGGILSAFKLNQESAVFVLACDLPFFDAEAARTLHKRRSPHKKATAFFNDNNVEPLCAIYEPSIILDLETGFASGKYCPRAILSGLDIEKVTEADPRWLLNINHAHELAALKTEIKKTVVVYYYASLREQAQCSKETICTTASCVGELFLELKKKYAFSMSPQFLRFAKNERLVLGDEPIVDHDEIVFLPPVSGG